MLLEIAMQIKELGYKLIKIDTSTNSTLNALIYNERVDVSPDTSWVLLLVENNCCRVISMQGRNYVDCYEELISIGEVLGDEENYSTVINAVNPILKNLPSQCLYVVSKTNLISAKLLADKLEYGAQIVHQESNYFSTAPFLPMVSDIDVRTASGISLDTIGAAITRDFGAESTAHINLFNASLGDIYLLEQPPILKIGDFSIVFSMENMVLVSVIITVIAVVLTLVALLPLNGTVSQKKGELSKVEANISQIQSFLDENKLISSELFDEGDEIRVGLMHNKAVYTYYTIVGTEIPKKLWLTSLKFDKYITIEGQADNLESIYAFFRNIKDYDPESNIKLQKLGLATKSKLTALTEEEVFDTDSIITSMNADFYEFRISNAPEVQKTDNQSKKGAGNLPDLEPIE